MVTYAVLGLDPRTPLCGTRMLVTYTPDDAVAALIRVHAISDTPTCGFGFAIVGTQTLDAAAFVESLRLRNELSWGVS